MALNQSKRYRNFIHQRDQALEHLLRVAQKRSSEILRHALIRVLEIVHLRYSHLSAGTAFVLHSKRILHDIEAQIERVFTHSGGQILGVWVDLGQKSQLLAYAGEVEAIGRALGRPAKLEQIDLDQVPALDGGESLPDRIALAFNRMRREIMNAVELSRAMNSPMADCLKRISKKFPSTRPLPSKGRTLKRVTEARSPWDPEDDEEDGVEITQVAKLGSRTFATGFVDEETWGDLVADYKTKHIPIDRSAKNVFDVDVGDPELEEMYGWELEQQMTQDFVNRVRSGQVQAANDNGIDEFVWVAILDDRTDECCVWRDGLTTSEIEAELEADHAGDECDAIVPPAHFNCRCVPAPVSKDQLSDDQSEPPGDFDEWLNQMGRDRRQSD